MSEEAQPGAVDAALRASFSWPSWAAATTLCVGVAVLLGRPAVAHALQIPNGTLRFVLLSWPVTYAVAVLYRDFVLGNAIARSLMLVHGLALWTALGACTSSDVGPGYALLLMLPPCWGQLFAWNRVILFGLPVVPLGLRLASVPDPTPRSLFFSVAAGAVTAGLFAVFSLRRSRLARIERRALAAEALFAGDVDAAAGRAVALWVHDTLSGALALAHARAMREAAAGVLGAGSTFARQARGVLANLGDMGPDEDLREGLVRFAREVGVPATIDVDVAGASRDSSMASLRDILRELLANEARHGRGDLLRIDVRFARRRLIATLRGGDGARAAPGPGRGVRNLQLRAAARGGSLERDAERGQVTVVLPCDEGRSLLWPSLWLAEAMVHLAPPVVGWLATHSLVVSALLAAPSAVLLVLQVRNGQSAGAAQARLRAALARLVSDAMGGPRWVARSAIGSQITRLEEALSSSDPAAVRASLTETTSVLERLLGSLEAEPAPETA
jgi:hypothetical protein